MSARVSSFAQLLARGFALALQLYPAGVRREYGAEMQAVFRMKVADGAQQGAWKLISLAWREMRDLPPAVVSAHVHANGGLMDAYFPSTSDRTPWGVALLSLLPFFIGGTLRLILSYQPGWTPREQSLFYLLFLLLGTLAVLAGLVLGSAKKFPRWAYPYPFYLAFSLSTLVAYAVFVYQLPFNTRNSFLFFLALILVVLLLPGLRTFYGRIRQDWTLLSFGLYGFALYLLSTVDFDETPRLTLLVLLPSLISLLAALAHLRIRSAPVRIAVLLAGTYASLFFFLLPIFQGMVSVWFGIIIGSFMLLGYGMLLTAILLAPVLVSNVIQFWRTRQAAR